MNTPGPHERALLESTAVGLYEDAVAEDGLRADDPRLADDAAERPAFDVLVELGLLHREGEVWRAADPATVQAGVVSPMTQEGTRLLEESAALSRALGTLAQAYRRSPAAQSSDLFTYLRATTINPFIAGMVAEAREEVLTAQPQIGRDAQTIAAAALRDTALLERGAKLRTLYQHSARRSSVTQKYVAAVTARGAQVRTLDEFFRRMIIADRRIAIIPATEDHSVALAVREPAIVAFLVDMFERSWERARPFGDRESAVLADIANEQRAMTIRMLIEGHSDPVSAKRLGVSPRTFAGYVADLKAEYDAETRFQLGYTMGRAQVTGLEEPADPTDDPTDDPAIPPDGD
ncbi:LuxR family transcriptional regulator [Nocardioides sp.]|uniref:LuxR family transcriptional regulator n=1 Tax=Nocardioides sp. TaxID=35761 RepID=UPI00351421CE